MRAATSGANVQQYSSTTCYMKMRCTAGFLTMRHTRVRDEYGSPWRASLIVSGNLQYGYTETYSVSGDLALNSARTASAHWSHNARAWCAASCPACLRRPLRGSASPFPTTVPPQGGPRDSGREPPPQKHVAQAGGATRTGTTCP